MISYRRVPLVLLLAAGLLVSACSSGGGSKAAFCNKAGDLKDLGNSLGDAKTLPQIKTAFNKLGGKIKDADNAAPSDIKKDVDTIKKAFDDVNVPVQKTKSQADLGKLTPQFNKLTDDKGIKSAGDRVTAYTKKNCKIDLSS